MNKKIFFSLIVAMIVAVLAWISLGTSTFSIYQGPSEWVDAKVVKKIPPGFIHLEMGGNRQENGLRYVAWESQISFLDADGICIYQTSFANSDFIVKFKNEYYVNEEIFLELMKVADISPETRRKMYSLGEEVEVYGIDETMYIVKITEVEAIKIDDATTYRVKYKVTPNGIENGNRNFIYQVETKEGVTFDEFDFIDEETAIFNIPANRDRKIGAIILRSPDYMGLTYRVVVD